MRESALKPNFNLVAKEKLTFGLGEDNLTAGRDARRPGHERADSGLRGFWLARAVLLLAPNSRLCRARKGGSAKLPLRAR